MVSDYKIIVAVPPIYDFYFTPHRISSTGAKIAVSELAKYFDSVKLIDFASGRLKIRKAEIPEDLLYLEEYLQPEEYGPLSFFTSYMRRGKSIENAAMEISKQKPDAVIISSFAYAYSDESVALAAELKKLNPGIVTAAAGASTAALPEYFLESGKFDFVIQGEAETVAEKTAEQIVNAVEKYRSETNLSESVLLKGDVLCSSPMPAFTEVFRGFSAETDQEYVRFSVSLVRGCSKRCSFCSNFLSQGRTLRLADRDSVSNSLKQISEKFNGYKVEFNFEDDNLMMVKEYFFSVLDEVRELFSNCSLTAENGLDYMLMDSDVVEYLKLCGFCQLNLSLGTYSAQQLDAVSRPGSLRKFEEVTAAAEEHNIPVIAYFISGLKGDSPEKIVETLNYFTKLPVTVGISLFYAVPGLPGFEDKAAFLNRSSHICSGAAAYPWFDGMTILQQITSFRLARLVNLMSKTDCSSVEKELLSKVKSEKKLFTLERGSDRIIAVRNQDKTMVSYFFDLYNQNST